MNSLRIRESTRRF